MDERAVFHSWHRAGGVTQAQPATLGDVIRMVAGSVVVTVAVLGAVPGSMPRTAAGSPARPLPPPVVYRLPVDGAPVVVRAFEPPESAFGAGHRGVDLAGPARRAVRAAADGVVTFAGVVAGRGVVVVLHADGIRTEYEPVRPVVRSHESVERGAVIGYVEGHHGACLLDRCLHWGARRGAAYFDPLPLLKPLGAVRLAPWPPESATRAGAPG